MNTTELIARPKYAEKFSRLWERYDEACHGNAQQMRDILEITLDALETAERHIFKTDRDYLALVEALESAQKSNAFLKDQLSELANFNPDWDKLEASYESWREIAAELLAAKGRIAELEGRAIKFPPKVERDDSDGYWMLKGQRVSAANAAYYNEALKDVALALFAAGIKCEVKGE